MKTTIKALLLILTVAFFSCQKNDVINPATDLSDLQLKSATIAANDVAVENVAQEANFETFYFGGYERMLRELARVKGRKGNLFAGKSNMHYMNGLVPVVSIDTAEAGYPITITIDYGDEMITRHGREISGKVVIELSGPQNTDGTTRNISYIGCKIDSIGIEGTSTETFNGDNTTTRLLTNASNVNFTLPDGTVIVREGNTVREWLQGLNTPLECDDDMVQITGKINVSVSTGDNYVREITEPLIRLGDCRHPVQGIVQYTKNDALIAELNYGDGTCDNLATLTTDGATVEIELKGMMPKAKTNGTHMGGKMGGNMGNHN